MHPSSPITKLPRRRFAVLLTVVGGLLLPDPISVCAQTADDPVIDDSISDADVVSPVIDDSISGSDFLDPSFDSTSFGASDDPFLSDPFGASVSVDPTRFHPQFLRARLTKLHLDNIHKRVRIVRDILINVRYRQANAWTQLELNEFRRLIRKLKRDMREVLRKKRRLEVDRRRLAAFLNGRNTYTSFRAFERLLPRMASTSENRELLAQTVPKLRGDEFVPLQGPFRSRGLSRATLRPPPIALAGACADDPIHHKRDEFALLWIDATQRIAQDQMVTPVEYLRLQTTLETWWRTAQRDFSNWDAGDRRRAVSYYRDVNALIDRLKSPDGTEKVRRCLAGCEFQGGTVAGLLDHLKEHRIAPRFGSQSGLKLKGISASWIKEIEEDIAAMNALINEYDAANPSHRAVLKDVIRTQSGSFNSS